MEESARQGTRGRAATLCVLLGFAEAGGMTLAEGAGGTGKEGQPGGGEALGSDQARAVRPGQVPRVPGHRLLSP